MNKTASGSRTFCIITLMIMIAFEPMCLAAGIFLVLMDYAFGYPNEGA